MSLLLFKTVLFTVIKMTFLLCILTMVEYVVYLLFLPPNEVKNLHYGGCKMCPLLFMGEIKNLLVQICNYLALMFFICFCNYFPDDILSGLVFIFTSVFIYVSVMICQSWHFAIIIRIILHSPGNCLYITIQKRQHIITIIQHGSCRSCN